MKVNNNMKWYAIRTHEGKENFVAERLRQESERPLCGLYNKVGDVLISKDVVASVKDGKKVKKEIVAIPGYIFIETNSVGDVRATLRNIRFNYGFVSGRNQEVSPLTLSEVNKMLGRNEEIADITIEDEVYIVGETVVIMAGPFQGFKGTIAASDDKKVIVNVSIFGRVSPVELDINQIDRNLNLVG